MNARNFITNTFTSASRCLKTVGTATTYVPFVLNISAVKSTGVTVTSLDSSGSDMLSKPTLNQFYSMVMNSPCVEPSLSKMGCIGGMAESCSDPF